VVYVPGIMTLGIIAASFVNLFISVTAQRETGVLKRRRATHGTVQATRERPRISFPPIITSVMRALAKRRRPYRCPVCDAAVKAD
jgi:hypothetical protein